MRFIYEEIPGVDPEKVRGFHDRAFTKLLRDENVRPFYSSSERSCLLLRHSPWDSDIFSMGIGHIPAVKVHPSDSEGHLLSALDTLLEYGQGKDLSCIIGRFYTDDSQMVPLLLKKGFTISEILVMMWLRINDVPGQGLDEGLSIRPVRSDEVPLIQEMITGNYENHFSLDRRFPAAGTRRMFREWMKNSIEGRVDHFLAASKGDQILGFLALKLLKEEEAIFGRPLGFVEMIVLERKYRRNGFAEALMRAGVNRISHQCDYVILNVALSNVSAVNFYAKVGFRVLSSKYTFHGWLKDII